MERPTCLFSSECLFYLLGGVISGTPPWPSVFNNLTVTSLSRRPPRLQIPNLAGSCLLSKSRGRTLLPSDSNSPKERQDYFRLQLGCLRLGSLKRSEASRHSIREKGDFCDGRRLSRHLGTSLISMYGQGRSRNH